MAESTSHAHSSPAVIAPQSQTTHATSVETTHSEGGTLHQTIHFEQTKAKETTHEDSATSQDLAFSKPPTVSLKPSAAKPPSNDVANKHTAVPGSNLFTAIDDDDDADDLFASLAPSKVTLSYFVAFVDSATHVLQVCFNQLIYLLDRLFGGTQQVICV